LVGTRLLPRLSLVPVLPGFALALPVPVWLLVEGVPLGIPPLVPLVALGGVRAVAMSAIDRAIPIEDMPRGRRDRTIIIPASI
jgi:hypothetical protein